MKKILLVFLISFISLTIYSQDCSILAKANNISPDRLCSPVTATWNVSYAGVNNVGTPVSIRYNWDNGVIITVPATQIGAGIFEATAVNTYTALGNVCNYHPTATLVVNGQVCSSSSQQQIVTVWDDDDHNGGHMRINPVIWPICFGNGDNARFQDVTQFNCVPPQERDVPNLFTRWVQWIYGTDITMTGVPITINGTSQTFPYSAPIITLPGPVTGSGILSDWINVANDKLIGQYFEITLRNWNYCNPYDDPNIPGPPADLINGDHPPVTTTARVLIVGYPDPTITPLDTFCINSPRILLNAATPGGTWTGPGVMSGYFYPNLAGIGTHTIRYNVTSGYGCSAADTEDVTVTPLPFAHIDPIGTVFLNGPPVIINATPYNGGILSGNGITANETFIPSDAGLGTHIIQYITFPDKYGCVGQDTIHIQVILPPIPLTNWEPDTSGCTPLTVQFRNLSTGGESYLWDFGDKIFSNQFNPIHTYYVPGNYIVRLTTTNVAGSSYHVGIITVYQNPTAQFNVYPTEVVNNSQIVTFYNYSQYNVSQLWKFGDGFSSTDLNPVHKYETPGTYEVWLNVTSKDGCKDSVKFNTPIVVDFIKGEIHFPNAFKWNGTGPTGGFWKEGVYPEMDYVFRPHFENVIKYQLQIFNRWGTLIYESHDLYKGWDGYWNTGNLAVQGVYVWKVKGRYANGDYFNKVGDVTFLH
jgi:PKD repeat protein